MSLIRRISGRRADNIVWSKLPTDPADPLHQQVGAELEMCWGADPAEAHRFVYF